MTTKDQPSEPVIARAGSYYRRTRYIMFLLMFGFGVMAILDGFKRYPEHDRKFDEISERLAKAKAAGSTDEVGKIEEELRKHGAKHAAWDIPFNQIAGIVLPPISLAVLAWVLYRSRGEIKMENQTISVPGHPPVPFGAITAIDTRLWDRKGIAQVEYAIPGGASGKFTLDDFIYDRPPIDKIYDSITAYVNKAVDSGETDSAAPSEPAAQ